MRPLPHLRPHLRCGRIPHIFSKCGMRTQNEDVLGDAVNGKFTHSKICDSCMSKQVIRNDSSDKQEIRNMSPENKAYRKKFSDAVSGVMRKLKKYIYEDCRHYRQCILCSKDINWLLVMCVGCKTCFHLGCLKRFGKKCSRCNRSFQKNDKSLLSITN